MKCPYCGVKAHVYANASDEKPKRNRMAPFTVRRYQRCPNGHHFRTLEEPDWDRTVSPVVGRIDAA